MLKKIGVVLVLALGAVGCSSLNTSNVCCFSGSCAGSVGVGSYEGPTFEVASWKGELSYQTVEEKFAGDLALCIGDEGCEKSGVRVELLKVTPVEYRTSPGSHLVGKRYDLVTPGISREHPSVICKISVSKDAKPGNVSFGPMSVRVVDRVLPPPTEWKYFLDLWQHPWAVSRFHGVKPFSDEHYAKMEPIYKTLVECGVKALTVTLLDYPWNHQCYDAYESMIGRVKNDDGSWSFDYTVFDKYVEFGRKCGIGPDIACYTMCPWGNMVRWKNSKGEVVSVKALPGSDEFKDYWGDFLVDFAKHLKEKGWFEDAYIAMDERSPEEVSAIAKFIREKVPGMKIAMAGNRKPSEFKDMVIDNYCQYLDHLTPDFLAECVARRRSGLKTTFYVCCGPDRPNTFMSSGDAEGFWLGVYPALGGMDGFLRWAANSWPHNPYVDAAFGTWKAGDTFFVYPNGEYSVRLISLRAGVVAAEKLRILNEAGLCEKERASFAEKYDFSKALNGKIRFRECRKDLEALVNRQ